MADALTGWAAAVRMALTPSWERKPQIPALRTDFMEDAAMRREMYRL